MKQLPELASFLEGLSEPHILFDANYRILSANAAYRQQYSPTQNIIGRRCYEVSHHFSAPCDQSGESCPLAKARISGQRERLVHLHHTPKGEEYINIELTPVLDEQDEPAFFVERMAPLLFAARGKAEDKGLIGRSASFQEMLSLIARVAPSMATVLLLGESGTGKELVAHAVHQSSARSQRPLVAVDCASIPESLFESELFGHERGAFTGASTARDGLVAAASGGTLFLDEVGDIPLSMQVKLLRLLETGTYRKVGSTELRHADIRVVSATHRDLTSMVGKGTFREDLYFRLSTFPIHLPPLRERKDDIPLLSAALLKRLHPQRNITLSRGAAKLLREQQFPGNIRELRNLLERAVLLCDGDFLEVGDLERALHSSIHSPRPTSTFPAKKPFSLKNAERSALKEMVEGHLGTREELANKLGISPRSLYRKLKSLRPD